MCKDISGIDLIEVIRQSNHNTLAIECISWPLVVVVGRGIEEYWE